MEKLLIKNRKGQNISVIVEGSENQRGLVFVMHGLGGFKEQVHIENFASTFLERSYTVVRFDTTNTLGESDGDYANATVTNYFEDLSDVIKWAKDRDWYMEPFVLVGHSLGGICTALYAQKYPQKVKALAPISTVVSGKLSVETYSKAKLKDWEKTGWLIKPSASKPGIMKKLKWSHLADRLKYDLLPDVSKLTMPVLLIVGEADTSTLPRHQKILFEKLPGPRELHIIKGAPHTFVDAKHLEEIKRIILNWIDKELK
ncbi:MAG: alpha/beta hydrolase [bacterium]|nr:alpha/beta hydrolase [bacterium]